MFLDLGKAQAGKRIITRLRKANARFSSVHHMQGNPADSVTPQTA